MDETVRLRVTIEISVDEECDTNIRLTVARWNAPSATRNVARSASGQHWDELAENDNGGTSVRTPGAVWI